MTWYSANKDKESKRADSSFRFFLEEYKINTSLLMFYNFIAFTFNQSSWLLTECFFYYLTLKMNWA